MRKGQSALALYLVDEDHDGREGGAFAGTTVTIFRAMVPATTGPHVWVIENKVVTMAEQSILGPDCGLGDGDPLPGNRHETASFCTSVRPIERIGQRRSDSFETSTRTRARRDAGRRSRSVTGRSLPCAWPSAS